MKRRNFIKNLALGTTASLFTTTIHAKITTPSEIEGPFYPIIQQKDKDADLTKVKGKMGIAKGDVIEVFGQITDQDLNPVENVTIDLWQANTFGKYHHPHDESTKPIDDNFQAWAIIQSNAEGLFKIKTIMPGAYPINGTEILRTPHIHFKIGKNGYVPLLTQMYFPNHPLNVEDSLIKRKTAEETESMTAKKIVTTSTNILQYQWNIVIEKL